MKMTCSRLIVLLFVFPLAIRAQDDIDYLSLTKILVKDGHYDRAQKTLSKVKANEVSDQALYKSLEGMILLHQKKYEQSVISFNESLRFVSSANEIFLYLAEAQVQLGQFSQALNSLDKLNYEFKQKLPYFIVKAEVHWQMKQKNKAWECLQMAIAKGLSKNTVGKKKFYYYLQEGLYLSALDLAFEIMNDDNNFNDVLAMASQFRLKKQYNFSLKLLQILLLKRPQHEVVALEMAQNYLAMGESFSAALILENTAKHNNSLNYEAAEILRQIGKSYRARFVNMTTLDPVQRLKQKIALHLEEDDYYSMQFLLPEMKQNKMLEDEEMRYVVAYSLFRVGEFKKAENYLNTIEKDDLFEKSIQLKKEIQSCEKDKWLCSETI